MMAGDLRYARNRLKPVKAGVSPPEKTTGVTVQQAEEIEDRKNTIAVNQTHVSGEPVSENRRPSKDAVVPVVMVTVASGSAAPDGNAKLPPKKTHAAVDSKSFAPSPPLPSRTRRPSPSSKRNTGEVSTRTVEPRSEVGYDNGKKASGSENSYIIDSKHLQLKDNGRSTAPVREPTPTRLTDIKRSGTTLLMLLATLPTIPHGPPTGFQPDRLHDLRTAQRFVLVFFRYFL